MVASILQNSEINSSGRPARQRQMLLFCALRLFPDFSIFDFLDK
jgi:hypothetical protein